MIQIYLFYINYIKNCFWHSIIGSDLISHQSKKDLDRCVLGGFSIFFAFIQIGMLVWFIRANKNVRKLEREEKCFLKNLKIYKNNQQNDRSKQKENSFLKRNGHFSMEA